MGFFRRLIGKPTHDQVKAKIDEIEAEMKMVGIWQQQAPPSDRMQVNAAFGQDKLPFEQWLQFIFLPQVRTIIATRGKWPSVSHVSDQAFREWQMWGSADEYRHLLDLLRQFDALF